MARLNLDRIYPSPGASGIVIEDELGADALSVSSEGFGGFGRELALLPGIDRTGATSSAAALAALPPGQYQVGPGTYLVDVATTVPAEVVLHVAAGAEIYRASGVVLTLNAIPVAGEYQFFTGPGTTVFAAAAEGGEVRAAWWGARPGVQVLESYNYSVGSSLPYALTQQTRSGIAVMQAAAAIGAAGGGKVKLGLGVFWTYGYVLNEHPTVEIGGEGILATTLRALPTAPVTNGYGVLQLGHSDASAPAGGYESFTASDLTIDGNILNRTDPAGSEYQAHACAVYNTQQVRLHRVRCINGACDALYINSGKTICELVELDQAYLRAGYRNTLTVVAGRNVQVNGGTILDGGVPWGGTNPKTCVDLEPNSHTEFGIEHVRFKGTYIAGAVNSLVSVTSSLDVAFEGCTLRDTVNGLSSLIVNSKMSDVSWLGCTFISDRGLAGNVNIYQGSQHDTTYPVLTRKGRSITRGCKFYGVGAQHTGHYTVFEDNLVQDSPMAVWIISPFWIVRRNTLVNVGWNFSNGGRDSSLQVGQGSSGLAKGTLEDNLTRVDEHAFLQRDIATVAPAKWYGIYLDSTNQEYQSRGNRAEGYYRWPVVKGGVQNSANFRDWRNPSAPPADSKSDTAVVAGNTMGGSAWQPEQFYRNLVP